MNLNLIKLKIQNQFNPEILELLDESEAHHGHAGNTGGAHLNLKIKSHSLIGKSRIEQHRSIQNCLVDEFKSGMIHALKIEVLK